MPTMLDVARLAGVALSTVSYTINGTRPISLETQQRIFAAMEELGYRPHALARGLASKHSRIIALLFSAPERGLGITELEFVTSAVDAARESGYHLVLWSSDMHDPNELRKFIQQGLVDGVIVMEVHENDSRVNLLREMDLPFSMIGRCGDTTGIGYADIDFEQAIGGAIDYLAGLGHTHIAFVNHSQAEFDAGYGPAIRVHRAFEQKMQALKLPGLTQLSRATPQAGYEAADQLLTENPDLTALIAMNDRAIPGLMQAIAERGWRIPDDFSLVAIVSSGRAAEMVMPPLTTMAPPTVELGRLGVDLLIQRLYEPAAVVSQSVLPCQLVVRGSSGYCRSHSVLASER